MLLSNLTFRPRAIDVDRPIPVRFEEQDDDETQHQVDGQTVRRTLPKIVHGIEEEEANEKHIKSALVQGMKRTNIPIPFVRDVDDYEGVYGSGAFQQPSTYIRIRASSDLDLFRKIEYDLDDDDFDWLEKYNNGVTLPSNRLSEDQMESLIDRFEKKTGTSSKLIAFKDANIGGILDQHSDNPCLQVSEQVRHLVYQYWAKKRERLGTPLLEKFKPPPKYNDPSPYVAFRPYEKQTSRSNKKSKRTDKQALIKLRKLRQELERGRMLLELCKSRERLKKEYLQNMIRIFEQHCIDAHIRGIDLYSARSQKRHRTSSHRGAASSSAHDYSSASESDGSGDDSSGDESDSTHDDEIVESLLSRIGHPSNTNKSLISEWSAPVMRPDACGQRVYMVRGASAPFRGRARLGRGGRILIDRRSRVPSNQIPSPLLPIIQDRGRSLPNAGIFSLSLLAHHLN